MRPTERRSTRPAPQARSLPPSLHCCFLRQPDPAGRPPLEDGRLSPCCGLLAGRARSGHGMVAAPVSPAPRDRRARQRHTSESARVVDVPSEGVSPASPGTLAHSESAAQMRPRSGLGFSAGRLPSLLFRVFSSESSLPSLLFRVFSSESPAASLHGRGARRPAHVVLDGVDASRGCTRGGGGGGRRQAPALPSHPARSRSLRVRRRARGRRRSGPRGPRRGPPEPGGPPGKEGGQGRRCSTRRSVASGQVGV